MFERSAENPVRAHLHARPETRIAFRCHPPRDWCRAKPTVRVGSALAARFYCRILRGLHGAKGPTGVIMAGADRS